MLVGPRAGVPRTFGQVAPTELAQEDPRTVGPKDFWALGLLAPCTLEPKDYWAAPTPKGRNRGLKGPVGIQMSKP